MNPTLSWNFSWLVTRMIMAYVVEMERLVESVPVMPGQQPIPKHQQDKGTGCLLQRVTAKDMHSSHNQWDTGGEHEHLPVPRCTHQQGPVMDATLQLQCERRDCTISNSWGRNCTSCQLFKKHFILPLYRASSLEISPPGTGTAVLRTTKRCRGCWGLLNESYDSFIHQAGQEQQRSSRIPYSTDCSGGCNHMARTKRPRRSFFSQTIRTLTSQPPTLSSSLHLCVHTQTQSLQRCHI